MNDLWQTILIKTARMLCIGCAAFWGGCAIGFCALGYVDYINNISIRDEIIEVAIFVGALLVSLWAVTLAAEGQLKLAFVVGAISSFCAAIATLLIVAVGHLCSSDPHACQDALPEIVAKSLRAL